MTYGVWCMMFDVCCIRFDVWCMMFHVWCLMYDVWCLCIVSFTYIYILYIHKSKLYTLKNLRWILYMHACESKIILSKSIHQKTGTTLGFREWMHAENPTLKDGFWMSWSTRTVLGPALYDYNIVWLRISKSSAPETSRASHSASCDFISTQFKVRYTPAFRL